MTRFFRQASGPLYPPKVIDERSFSCEEAAENALRQCNLRANEIDFWGIYDCFPICFVRGLEACGLAPRGQGGLYIERIYEKLQRDGKISVQDFPVNTHGGLLGMGAPWEVPAMYNIIESVRQISGVVGGERQVPNCRRAIVYGNGGIFSASAIAILGAAKQQ